jgi:hypothetical protein
VSSRRHTAYGGMLAAQNRERRENSGQAGGAVEYAEDENGAFSEGRPSTSTVGASSHRAASASQHIQYP